MIDLSLVDLIIVDCIKPNLADKILNHCKKEINFGRSVIFTSDNLITDNEVILIDKINDFNQYSDFILKLSDYLNNDYVLLVQCDGFILNPHLWDTNFLCFDYIGAPFSLNVGKHNVGNGGFSLRSKEFLQFSKKFKTTNGRPEDVFLTIDNYHLALDEGINFAPTELASNFSFENKIFSNLNYFNTHNHFGFHGSHCLSFIKDKRPDLSIMNELI